MKKLIYIIIWLITVILFGYFVTSEVFAYSDFNDYINSPVPKITEKSNSQLREEWNDLLHCDIFAPYYKLELFKDKIKSNCSFKFENFNTKLETSNYATKEYYIYYKFIWRR